MPKRGHRPERTCLGCGARDQQEKLIRLTATDQELRIDPQGSGRGGYLHRQEACWHEFLRRKSLYRAFRVDVDRSSREKLIRKLKEAKLGVSDG